MQAHDWLQTLIDQHAGRFVCMTLGCTTCGGSMGETLFGEWIRTNTRAGNSARAHDLAQALLVLRVQRKNEKLIGQLLDFLGSDWRYRDPELLPLELRLTPALVEAVEVVRRRRQWRHERRRAAFDRWKRMQPPEWHAEQARLAAAWAAGEPRRQEEARFRLVHNNPKWVAAYRANKKAAAAARHSARILAKIERELLSPPRQALNRKGRR